MDKYIKKGIIGAAAGIALMAAIATSAFVFNSEPSGFEKAVAIVNIIGALCSVAALLYKSFTE
ncbi:MAG: hypothetical protein IJ363_14000 [Clostridia bacterium]|nr:hypothetical protein [Clostridia bacterium]